MMIKLIKIYHKNINQNFDITSNYETLPIKKLPTNLKYYLFSLPLVFQCICLKSRIAKVLHILLLLLLNQTYITFFIYYYICVVCLSESIVMSILNSTYVGQQSGPIMLLLDSQHEKKIEPIHAEQIKPQNTQKRYDLQVRTDKAIIPETLSPDKGGQNNIRGRRYRASPISYYNNHKSIQRQRYGGQRVLERSFQKSPRSPRQQTDVKLPMIPKGKKKKIQI